MKITEELKKIENNVLTRKQIKEFEKLDYINYEEFKNPALTEETKIYVVSRDGWNIKFIINPSEAVQLAAVNNYGGSIQFIENPSEKIQLAAVSQNGWAIKHIDNPSEKVIELARSKGVCKDEKGRWISCGWMWIIES
jgi:hypothetical protein